MRIKDKYLQGKRIDIAYRGFKFWLWSTYFSLKPIHLGSSRLYRLGPIGLWVRQR